MPADTPQGSTPKSGASLALGAAAVAAVLGFAAVYVTLGRPDNAAPLPKSAPSPVSVNQPLPSGPGSNALSKGEMAAFVFRKEPEALPDFKFQDGSGKERTLADWRGKVVLLNLWATWCAPCREEMPELDALEKEMGGEDFAVVAVSVDLGSDDKPKTFYAEHGIDTLPFYHDGTMGVFNGLKKRSLAIGMPTTLLIDENSCLLGRISGPAAWASDDAKAMIAAALASPDE
jgi:thiol-disulfide isomerase/thioredoxin